MVMTPNGQITISEIVSLVQKDETVMILGFNITDSSIMELPVSAGWKAIEDADVIELEFSNGKTVRCTGNHPFLTPNGFVTAENLHKGSILLSPSPDKSPVLVAEPREIMVDTLFRSIDVMPDALKDVSEVITADNYVTLVDTRKAPSEDVYDIEIPLVNNFLLEAGVVVHNSHVRAALRLLNRAKVSDATKAKIRACVMRKNKALGCGVKSGDKDSLEIQRLAESDEFKSTRELLDFLEVLYDESTTDDKYMESLRRRAADTLLKLRNQDGNDTARDAYLSRNIFSLIDSILDHLEQGS